MSQSGVYGSGAIPPGPTVDTLTGNVGGPVGPTLNNIDIIGIDGVVVTGNPGASTLTISAPGSATTYDEDSGTASPSMGVLNVIGGATSVYTNINTFGSGNTIEVKLNDYIQLPNTNMAGNTGILYLGGDRFLHNYGTANNFLGQNAGNLTLTVLSAINNTGIGTFSLFDLTTGNDNTAIGFEAGVIISSGQDNTALGSLALGALTTGSLNIAIGSVAGSNYTGAESLNIVIGNYGTVSESNVLRLGTDGDQTAAYIAGIYNRTIGAVAGVVQIDSNFKLGSSAGTNGQVLIGATGGKAAWANITSTDSTITITNGAHTIDLSAGTDATSFVEDSGTATPSAGVLNVIGGATSVYTNINTFGSGSTVQIRLNDTIKLPNTNAGGTAGIIFLANNRFIHNLGTNNTFIGQDAGNLTLTTGSALNDTAVGTNSLEALTTGAENTAIGSESSISLTSGSGNTALGFGSLANMNTGEANVAIGSNAGTNYTGAETNNILISNDGVVSESDTIRIGNEAIQTATYVAGIYGQTVGSPNLPVFVDSTGKLGTGSGSNQGFLAILPSNDGTYSDASFTVINLGTNVVLSVISDAGGNFYPGDGIGTPASFTAPEEGLYQFNFGVTINYSGLGSAGASFVAVITTDARTYTLDALPSTSFNSKSNMLSCCANMSQGDTAQFGVAANISAAGWGFGSILTGWPTDDSCATWISGFKLL